MTPASDQQIESLKKWQTQTKEREQSLQTDESHCRTDGPSVRSGEEVMSVRSTNFDSTTTAVARVCPYGQWMAVGMNKENNNIFRN